MNDGGPAFPVFNGCGFIPGMSLRDYFAAKAMQGELSAQGGNSRSWDYDYEALAIRCYDIAEEMLKAREK